MAKKLMFEIIATKTGIQNPVNVFLAEQKDRWLGSN
jgi:hypothetical protein